MNAGTATVTNAGTIVGGDYAIRFAASAANRLIIDPGAVFSGTVTGGNAAGSGYVSTLELASAANGGTLSGLGMQYVEFTQTTIDAGAHWTLTGGNTLSSGYAITNLGTLTLSNATLTGGATVTNDGGIVIDPSSMTISSLIGTGSVTIEAASTLDVTETVSSGETIVFATNTGAFYFTPGSGNFAGQVDNFATGDTIGLNGITEAQSAGIVNGNTLAVTTSSDGTIDITMNPAYNLTGDTFTVTTANGDGIVIANDLPCFVIGTMIDTPDGPVAVENLRTGDLVCTATGGTRPVRWIGLRVLDLLRHLAPGRSRPIRICSDAMADGAPQRDLFVSPEHALFLDGRLIAARQLVNGATIRREDPASVVYHHVERERCRPTGAGSRLHGRRPGPARGRLLCPIRR